MGRGILTALPLVGTNTAGSLDSFLRHFRRQSRAPTGAKAFALFPPAQLVIGNACLLLFVDSCAIHVSTDKEGGFSEI
jgi:hypothetical protein